MKILITGNMGYIGPGVVRHLRSTYPKAALVGLDTGFFAHCLTNVNVFPEARVDVQYFHDIRDVTPAMVRGVDYVVNLAAISNDIMGSIDESITLDVNCRAGVRLARLAKAAGTRGFVFASSCSIYGFAADGARTETSPVDPLTAYARSKVLTEKALAPLADKRFKITCLRFATACGFSERLRLDLVLNDFVAGAVATKKITILSDGTPWRPLINVRDMARAIEWAIARKPSAGGPFLIVNAGANEWNFQVRDLAHAVARVIPGVEVSVNKDAPPDKRSYRVSFDLFKKLAPDHQPQVSLDQTIRELKEGLEAMNFRDANYRESNFIRLKVLSRLKERGLASERFSWNRVPSGAPG